MKYSRILALATICFVVGCGKESDSPGGNKEPNKKETNRPETKKDLPFNELVFDIIKSNDESRLGLIAISPEQEKTHRENAKMKVDPGLSEHSMKMAKMSLKLLHEETGKMGFDWAEAKLVKTSCRLMAANQPKLVDYAPDLDLSEVYLVVESKGKTIGIHLDDCAMIKPGVHVVGDGMRLMPESKLGPLKEK